jgi:asparagine synthase (glutamine-hydrolysing)
VAALYLRLGEEFVHKLNGKFSIAIFDSSANKLLFFRDRCGENIIYYCLTGSEAVFATSIRDIIGIAGKRKLIEPCAIDDTIYQGIKFLLPGHKLIYYLDGAKWEIKKYWSPFTVIKERDSEKVNRSLRDLLFDAAKIRYKKSKTAVLCGGFDTSLLCGIIKPPVVFSCFNDWDPLQSDIEYSQATAAFINAEQVWARPTKELFLKHLETMVLECGVPVNATGHIIHFLLAAKIKEYDKGFDAVIQGAGGDELFGPMRAAIIGWELQLYDNEYFRNYEVLLDRYYGNHVKRFLNLFRINEAWFKEYWDVERSDVLNVIHAISLFSVLQHELLMANKMFRYFGISTRNPFLDYRIVELALSYPKIWDVYNGEVKKILKNNFKDLLAPKVLDRKHKVGHSIPVHDWLDNYGRKYDTSEYLRRCTEILNPFCL